MDDVYAFKRLGEIAPRHSAATKNGKRRAIFAPVPARASADDRLNGLPLRALIAIALRDRFSLLKGGKGCILSNMVLCVELRCDEASLSRAIRRLEECGYLLREGTQRKRTLRVIYTDEDERVAAKSRTRLS
jgi:hypothetical protein